VARDTDVVCAGLLLTGGRSARMGRDKATIRVASGGGSHADPVTTLAERTARLLDVATEPALEVGPGYTHLRKVSESAPDNGPLSALVAGAAELRRLGWNRPVLVVATDLPRLSADMLGWLGTHEPGRSVVPLSDGRPQPLCARYEPGDLAVAARLVAEGRRSMTALLEATDPLLVPEGTWGRFAGDLRCLDDVDTPDQLDDYTSRLP
jgi:molybdopterin-guanine dinucleotide biosynthesis protein A